jgi:hypothetical protein
MRFALGVLLLLYLVLLPVLQAIGPYAALWGWSVAAFPAFFRHVWQVRGRAAALFVSGLWLLIAVIAPVAVHWLEQMAGSLPDGLAVALNAVTLTWPLTVTVAAFVLRPRPVAT